MTDKYDWLFRLETEKDDLTEKLTKLHDYLSSSRSVDDNGPEARELLLEQEKVMERYLEILNRRFEIGCGEMVKDKQYMGEWLHEMNKIQHNGGWFK